jgi:YidC/Oxa1 family membrane protein insertase
VPIEQIRSLLLIALAVVLFLLWQAWQHDYGPKPQQPTPPATAQQQKPPAGTEVPSGVPEVPSVPGETPSAPQPAPTAAEHPMIHVHTDVLDVEIDPKGGTLRQANLLDYPVSTQQPQTPVRLLNDTPGDLFLGESGLVGAAAAPNHHTLFTAERTDYQLAPGEDTLQVPLHWSSPSGVTVTKVYTFHRNSYVIDVSHRVRNDSTTPWSGRMYAQFERKPPPGQKHGLFHIYTYTGGVISTQDKAYEKISFDTMAEHPVERDTKDGWVAMIQQYFAGAWVPDREATNHYYSKALPQQRYVLGVMSSAHTIAPGSSGRLDMTLYVGPKVQSRLAAVAPHLERIIDYGWLWFISEPLFWLLQKIHWLLGNWGWSIVVLTFLIKLVFFPLSATSYKSMARMRRLQPRIQALRERYGSDKQRMNQAMMQIYKEEKINPLGGCLPIVVQIPVFIALYWVLVESVELRQAHFLLWINDLSRNDPYFVLPILMGIAMFIQQRLNPAPPDPMQAKIMMALPVVFTFFFLFFPAGLVLYWLVNNVLSIAQQWYITRRIVPATK